MKHIIAVVSGKGGVGKSTVAANLSIALARTGAKVALIDGDFYGPSVPTLFGGGEVKPDHEERLIPPQKFGVKYVSMGFFLPNPDDPIIWRGPMLTKAMNQLFQDVSWGEVDFCIVDMPPGTGDAALSLAQMVTLTGAVVVTTPQEVAMADVRKSMNMLEKVNVPVLGVVENMSGFTAPDGTAYPIFGTGGGQEICKKFDTELLASIPIDIAIREGGDAGRPAAAEKDSHAAQLFDSISSKVLDKIVQQGQQQAAPRIVN